jgi:hypothetical protein
MDVVWSRSLPCGVDEALCSADKGVGVTRGTCGGVGAARGVCEDTGATQCMTTVSGVSATEEE